MNKYQIAKREKGLCLTCDDPAVPGKSRCKKCLELAKVKQRMYYQNKVENDPEFLKKRNEYFKQWCKKNPDKVAVYKERKSEYNRRYEWSGVLDG